MNSCEYGWERNEGEKWLRPTKLPTGIKIAPDEILQTTRCKCVSTQYRKTINATVSELDLICDYQRYDDQSRMQMGDNEIEDEINDSESGTEDDNLLDMISLFIALI